MEIGEPATVMRIPITVGKRTTELEFRTRAECRDLIRAVAVASAGLPADDEPGLVLADDRAAPIVFTGSHGREEKLTSIELGDRLTAYDRSRLTSLLHFINGYCPAAVLAALKSDPAAPAAIVPGVGEYPTESELAAAINAGTANPPHHVTTDAEVMCQAPDNRHKGYTCTAQDGHDGPDHIAYHPHKEGEVYHRWPVTEPESSAGTALLGQLRDQMGVGEPVDRPGDEIGFDAGEGNRELGEPGRTLLAQAIAEQDAQEAAPVTYLACGDQTTDPASALLAVGAASYCEIHGVTEVISAEEHAAAAPALAEAVTQ